MIRYLFPHFFTSSFVEIGVLALGDKDCNLMPLQSRGVCLEEPLPPLGEAVKVVCLTQSCRTIVLVLCFIVS